MKRVFHTWDKWECYPAGFYENRPASGASSEECEATYAELLRDIPAFEKALDGVITRWVNSCEHYLTNENMNRIAWLGQAALCYARGIPACFRGGFNLLSADEQQAANESALKYLNVWLSMRGEPELTLDSAAPKTKANLY